MLRTQPLLLRPPQKSNRNVVTASLLGARSWVAGALARSFHLVEKTHVTRSTIGALIAIAGIVIRTCLSKISSVRPLRQQTVAAIGNARATRPPSRAVLSCHRC